MRLHGVAAAVLSVAMSAAVAATAQGWHVEKSFPLGGVGSWDYVTVDASAHRLYVTRGTHVMAVDADSGKLLADMTGFKGTHGVAIADHAGRGFFTDGGAGVIVVFDLKTFAILGKIQAALDADGIVYDESADMVVAVAGDSQEMFSFKPSIDLASGKAQAIKLGGKPEFLATDGETAYVSLEDKDVVAKVDLKAGKVVARWPVTPGGKPVGLSLDPAGHKLFIGCRGPQKLVVMSTADGKVLGSVDIGAGVDATAFAHGTAFASCRDGSLAVVDEKSGAWTLEQTVQTAVGSRTLGVDASAGKVYLPAADFEPVKPGARPVAKPDSFKILVVSK